MGRKIEFIIDDTPVVIPDNIKKMTKEELELEIEKLEKEAKEEHERLVQM